MGWLSGGFWVFWETFLTPASAKVPGRAKTRRFKRTSNDRQHCQKSMVQINDTTREDQFKCRNYVEGRGRNGTVPFRNASKRGLVG